MSGAKTNRINAFYSEPCEVIDVTYAELVALMAASGLDLCAVYRITDFQTLHKIPNTTDRNDTNVVIPVEVLLVKPASTSTLFSTAKSESYPDDIIEYTTDNTAWKDLTISGQKGCITLRIDTLRCIEVGCGDWRNFIVRRWAVDLSAYNRGAIVWKLWNTSVTCGVLSTGADQTFTALDTNLYNATTNPDGYRDFRIFDTATTTIHNVNIGAAIFDDVTFPMPNMFVENVSGFSYASNSLDNVKIVALTNATFTTQVSEIQLNDVFGSIFTDPINGINNLIGSINTSFISKRLFAEGKIGNLLNITLWENTSDLHGTQGITIYNVVRSFINLTGNESDFNGRCFAITLENIACAYCVIAKQKANAYILRNFNFNAIINSSSFGTAKDLSAYTTNLKYDPISNSNIEISAAAAAAITLSSGTGATVLDMFAGIINLTGSGTVNIETLTRFLPNNFPVTLKPEAGLTISIAQNNVANGFVNKDVITANGTNGEIIILTPVGDRWIAEGNQQKQTTLPYIYSLLGGSIKYEPVMANLPSATSIASLADGTLIIEAIYIDKPTTITGVKWFQYQQGNYTADNYNGVGLYTYSGGTLTLVASSTDDGAIWKATANSWASKAFSAAYIANTGIYFVAAIYNNSAQVTAPSIMKSTGGTTVGDLSIDFTNGAKLSGIKTGQASLPTPLDIATVSGAVTGNNMYLALY